MLGGVAAIAAETLTSRSWEQFLLAAVALLCFATMAYVSQSKPNRTMAIIASIVAAVLVGVTGYATLF